MNCQKCGAELHPEQKVCLECGARTAAGGAFYVDEKQPWRPSRNMIICAAAVVFLLIVVGIVSSLRTVPPEVVARQWFDALVQRQVRKAADMTTPQMQQTLAARNEDMRAISDEYHSAIVNDAAQWSIREPLLEPKNNPTRASVTIVLKYPDGHVAEVIVQVVKVGRCWRIDGVS